jgi:probable rRNA maturation factor
MKTIFESENFAIGSNLRSKGSNSEKGTPKIDGALFHSIKEKVLGEKYELSLVFVGRDLMRRLNRETRGKDYATDILSFGFDESADDCDCGHDHGHNHSDIHDKKSSKHDKTSVQTKALAKVFHGAGEIFINPEKARSNAKEFDRSFENYLKFLFVHGLMHLKGHDHEDDMHAEEMEKEEEKIRKAFKI